jgi:CheY-like chemotaxis protein
MKKFGNDPSTMGHIKIIKRNADRLLHLTNQVLDFRLIELNKIKLKREKEDIVSLCRNAYDCFEYEATEKQINCIFNSSFKSFYLHIDAGKIEKIVYNLLSNALKYSPEKGQIILSIEQKTLDENSYSKINYTGFKFLGNSLEVKVKDNGKGIKKENITQVFDRFFIDHEREETGIGIGLHMCQEYIHLHNGNIMVASEEGNGTVFSVNIPIEHNTEYEKEDMIIQYHFDKIAGSKQELALNTELSKTNKLVLYVEDNDELRIYFKDLLSVKYKVLTAKNGQQAFEIASEVLPDLIISDILMPGMDGLELTDNIRKTTKTNHIPVILLTALSDQKYKIESMSKGANTFITKPVDESFLFATIENIFRGQETIKKKIEGLANEKISALNVNDPFIERAKSIVEKNLQIPSFTITEFAAQLSMSRSSLQRKTKTEVNLSPTEFIRDIRLKKAIELMKSGSYNIDEIGLLVGFNSTSYFIRSFKKKYGKTPFAFQSELKVQKK